MTDCLCKETLFLERHFCINGPSNSRWDFQRGTEDSLSLLTWSLGNFAYQGIARWPQDNITLSSTNPHSNHQKGYVHSIPSALANFSFF